MINYQIKTFFWDFDGVILDSMPIRDYGFAKIFEEFDKELVVKLLEYHSLNGGLSRYVKIRYFYNILLKEDVSDEKVQELADKFSIIMKAELINKKYLIGETVEFIKANYQNYNFHIVSGSDGKELNYLCKELGLSKYFKTIEGSPTPKNDLVKNILQKYSYNPKECILIGDSINDYEAAKVNSMKFYGYNNERLRDKGEYIESFKNFEENLNKFIISGENMEVKIDKYNRIVLFVCSPSLGILDSWISVLKSLKDELSDAQFIFISPQARTINEIKIGTVLFNISSDIFDLIVFKPDYCNTWLFAYNFADAMKINSSSRIPFFYYAIRVFEKLKLKQISKIIASIYNFVASKIYSKFKFNFDSILNKNYFTLYDIYELDKPYNKELYKIIVNNSNFSILHGININGFDDNNEKKYLNVNNSTVYAYSEKEVDYYKYIYGVKDEQIKVYGIPRHEKQWINFLVDKENIKTKDEKYIFVISRPTAEYLPYDRKKKYLEIIKNISSQYGLKVIIKLHPKEKESDLFQIVFGLNNYKKNWEFSTLHPFILGKNCEFAVSFFSGVPVDLIILGTPTIELLDLKGIEKYDNIKSLRDSNGEPVFSYRYLNLVLGSSTYDEFEKNVKKIINDKPSIMTNLEKAYNENFVFLENVNQIVVNDILTTINKKKKEI